MIGASETGRLAAEIERMGEQEVVKIRGGWTEEKISQAVEEVI
jgi:hypothetical protein